MIIMHPYILRSCLLLIAMSSLTASCQHTLSKREFLKVYYDSVTRRLPNVKFRIVDDSTITGEFNGMQARHSIDNAYIDYKGEPNAIGPVISRYVATTVELYTTDRGLTSDNIIPVIKPVSFLAGMGNMKAEMGAKKGFDAVYERYNDQLIIAYAQDKEAGISYFSREDLKKMGIPKDSIRGLAVKNLAQLLDTTIQLRGGDGMYMITAGGNYEASILLLDYVWTKENISVNGDFIIAIPSRDVLLITGSNDKPSIEKMRAAVRKLYTTGSYPVSEYLYRRDGNKFVKYE